jgi:hypothetical protein
MQENSLLVASEIKAFLPLGWKAEWDLRSLLDDGWLHDERTLFRGVQKARLPVPARQNNTNAPLPDPTGLFYDLLRRKTKGHSARIDFGRGTTERSNSSRC